jgi:hypothetical protein
VSAAWRLSALFIRGRASFRTENFMAKVGNEVFDATAARFFAFLR